MSTEQNSFLETVSSGLRRLLRQGSLGPSTVLSCPELIALAPAAHRQDDGVTATVIAELIALVIRRAPEGQVLSALFGLDADLRGAPLRDRRAAAARMTGVAVETFRIRREPRVLDAFARLLLIEASFLEEAPRPAEQTAPDSRDWFDEVTKAQAGVSGMRDYVARDAPRELRGAEELLHSELDKLHRASLDGTTLTGTPSGYPALDEITGGFHPGNLIVLGARPGLGKSTLVANIAERAAVAHGSAVALFSLEMTDTELAQRLVASAASIRGEDLRRGRVPEQRWPKILAASERIAAAPLWIDGSSNVGTAEIRSKARRLQSQLADGLGLIIVDSLQLLRTDGSYESRSAALAEQGRRLKLLARELDAPVIVVTQLGPAVDARPDKVPMLSDLRDAGNLEQDADLVLFLHRDEHYHGVDSERPGEADVILAKHRNGLLGTVTLSFERQYPRFADYEPAAPDPDREAPGDSF